MIFLTSIHLLFVIYLLTFIISLFRQMVLAWVTDTLFISLFSFIFLRDQVIDYCSKYEEVRACTSSLSLFTEGRIHILASSFILLCDFLSVVQNMKKSGCVILRSLPPFIERSILILGTFFVSLRELWNVVRKRIEQLTNVSGMIYLKSYQWDSFDRLWVFTFTEEGVTKSQTLKLTNLRPPKN